MKIGYDGKRAIRNMTGLGNYSRFVIEAIAREYPDEQLIAYAPRIADNPRLKALHSLANVEFRGPDTWLGRKMGSAWRSGNGLTRQLIRDKIDLYHGLSNELPRHIETSGIGSVVTIHDLIWRRVPQDYSAIDRRLYNLKYGRSAKSATRVIAISECTKRDLITDFNIPADRIDVIYQGCHDIFRQTPSEATLDAAKAKFGLPERFIAMVGTVQSRKNQLLAVKAMRAIDPKVKLVIVGRRTKPYSAEIDRYIAANRLIDRIVWIEGASLEELTAIYSLATVAAYPSRYEGFGIPVIEAINMSTPVIAATGSCLEEAGGPGAIYVDPDSVDEFADTACRLLADAELRERTASAGREYVARFNNSQFARQTMATYLRAIEEAK